MDYGALRKRMVKEQLIARGISDKRVLEVFEKVERHKFLRKKEAEGAYADHPLPIGEGQTISQPYMAALMTESLHIRKGDRVLEIGTGSGYQTAILCELAKEVFSVERMGLLAERAKAALKDMGYGNVRIKAGDGTIGWPENAPYDCILVTAGAPDIPEPLTRQMAPGGRMVIPVGYSFSQVLKLVKKAAGDNADIRDICGCVFVPLMGRFGWRNKG